MRKLVAEFPVKLVEVELDQEVPSVIGLKDYRFLNVLVRLHGEPLGTIYIGIVNGRCMSWQIKREILKSFSWQILQHLIRDGLAGTLDKPMLELSELVDLPHPPTEVLLPTVSVAICTRNRPGALAQCLEAMAVVNYPDFEVIVVDNAPSDNRTRVLVEEEFSQYRYIHEPRPGLDWARNRAIAAAKGEIIAFTDDDVVVDRDWLLAIGKAFAENPKIKALTGLVLPYELETAAQVLFEARGGFGRGFQRRWHQVDPRQKAAIKAYLGTGSLGTGANMAFHATVFDDIGLFDTALDVGTLSNGAGDLDIFFRVLHGGHALLYEPQALVFHRHRRDLPDLEKQIKDSGTGLAAYHAKCMNNYRGLRFSFLRFHLWWLWEWHIKRLLQSYTQPIRFPRELMWVELKGYIKGITKYKKAQKAAKKIAREFGGVTEEEKGGIAKVGQEVGSNAIQFSENKVNYLSSEKIRKKDLVP